MNYKSLLRSLSGPGPEKMWWTMARCYHHADKVVESELLPAATAALGLACEQGGPMAPDPNQRYLARRHIHFAVSCMLRVKTGDPRMKAGDPLESDSYIVQPAASAKGAPAANKRRPRARNLDKRAESTVIALLRQKCEAAADELNSLNMARTLLDSVLEEGGLRGCEPERFKTTKASLLGVRHLINKVLNPPPDGPHLPPGN